MPCYIRSTCVQYYGTTHFCMILRLLLSAIKSTLEATRLQFLLNGSGGQTALRSQPQLRTVRSCRKHFLPQRLTRRRPGIRPAIERLALDQSGIGRSLGLLTPLRPRSSSPLASSGRASCVSTTPYKEKPTLRVTSRTQRLLTQSGPLYLES